MHHACDISAVLEVEKKKERNNVYILLLTKEKKHKMDKKITCLWKTGIPRKRLGRKKCD
jgi:hypothetical protein